MDREAVRSTRRAFGRGSAFDIVTAIIVGPNLSRTLTGNAPMLPTLIASLALVLLRWALSMLAFRSHWLGLREWRTVAEAESLSEPAIIAAQSAGGAFGNAVAPADVVLGATTAGIAGREGEVLRKTIQWMAATAVLIGAATVALITLL